MKIIQKKISNYILRKGYSAITIWPFIFVRTDRMTDDVLINHEKIHGRQQLEMLLVGFYLWYVAEWLVRLFMKGNAYRNISFEREAYANEYNVKYLRGRRHYAWIRYMKNK